MSCRSGPAQTPRGRVANIRGNIEHDSNVDSASRPAWRRTRSRPWRREASNHYVRDSARSFPSPLDPLINCLSCGGLHPIHERGVPQVGAVRGGDKKVVNLAQGAASLHAGGGEYLRHPLSLLFRIDPERRVSEDDAAHEDLANGLREVLLSHDRPNLVNARAHDECARREAFSRRRRLQVRRSASICLTRVRLDATAAGGDSRRSKRRHRWNVAVRTQRESAAKRLGVWVPALPARSSRKMHAAPAALGPTRRCGVRPAVSTLAGGCWRRLDRRQQNKAGATAREEGGATTERRHATTYARWHSGSPPSPPPPADAHYYAMAQ